MKGQALTSKVIDVERSGCVCCAHTASDKTLGKIQGQGYGKLGKIRGQGYGKLGKIRGQGYW